MIKYSTRYSHDTDLTSRSTQGVRTTTGASPQPARDISEATADQRGCEGAAKTTGGTWPTPRTRDR